MKSYIIIITSFLLVAACDSGDVVIVDGEEKTETSPDPIVDPDPSSAVTAAEVILAMGPGFNLGNTFEFGINSHQFDDVKPVIDTYQAAGMKHVRIPTTWMDRFTDPLADANGNVDYNHPRFIELVKLIDYAISLDMFVVLNTHHEHWLKDNYDGSSDFDDKFSRLWGDIATYFKDYPNLLIFEILNEPEGEMGEWDGAGGFPDPTSNTAIGYTRQIMEVGYNAIRTSGGSNETRTIMLAVNAQGNQNQLDDIYPTKSSLPNDGDDDYLAVQVHTYDPWGFCGQDGSNSSYPGDSSITSTIDAVATHASTLGVPVNYGEFGVGRNANPSERDTDLVRNYYKLIANTTLGHDMSYSVWDDAGWFGLISRSAPYDFTFQIVPVMLSE